MFSTRDGHIYPTFLQHWYHPSIVIGMSDAFWALRYRKHRQFPGLPHPFQRDSMMWRHDQSVTLLEWCWGFHKWWYTPIWIVYAMENPTKIGWIWGPPHFRKAPCIQPPKPLRGMTVLLHSKAGLEVSHATCYKTVQTNSQCNKIANDIKWRNITCIYECIYTTTASCNIENIIQCHPVWYHKIQPQSASKRHGNYLSSQWDFVGWYPLHSRTHRFTVYRIQIIHRYANYIHIHIVHSFLVFV